MAGHNKWSKIKNKKGKEDVKRAKVFSKLARMITVAAKDGGADLDYNPNLKNAIEKAKAENMPSDNIDRAVKKASTDADSGGYQEVVYEGYGPAGVAVLVITLTDNRNRTAPELRHLFDKYGGKLGTAGSVAYQFNRMGLIVIEDKDFDEETLMEMALELGAEDLNLDGEFFEITSSTQDFPSLRDGLAAEGYEFLKAELAYLPENLVALDQASSEKMEKLIEALEDLDDVQDIYYNWDE